ncbi:MAG: hypothetical protein V2A74_02320 [bacterium]
MRQTIQWVIMLVLGTMLVAAVVPNFSDAQLRQRLARVHNDLAAMCAAVEAYKVDYGKYPYDGYFIAYPPPGYDHYWGFGYSMTTPVAYIDQLRVDPFREDGDYPVSFMYRYRYTNIRSTWGTDYSSWTQRTSPSPYLDETLAYWGEYRVLSTGPDGLVGPFNVSWYYNVIPYTGFNLPYDPTNGALSLGDIERSQKFPPYKR